MTPLKYGSWAVPENSQSLENIDADRELCWRIHDESWKFSDRIFDEREK